MLYFLYAKLHFKYFINIDFEVKYKNVNVLKGWLTVFFSRLDCVYGVQSSMCS